MTWKAREDEVQSETKILTTTKTVTALVCGMGAAQRRVCGNGLPFYVHTEICLCIIEDRGSKLRIGLA